MSQCRIQGLNDDSNKRNTYLSIRFKRFKVPIQLLLVNGLVSDQQHEVLQIVSAERSILVRIGQMKDFCQEIFEFRG